MDAPPNISITVIGGGPAGLAIVGNLLESKWQGSIVWIDPEFKGGRLNEYREVPSISLVRDFMGYALAVEVFRDIIYRNNPMAFSTLRINGLSIHCPLGHVADALIALTNGVAELDQVVLCKGRVLNVDMNPVTSQWTVMVRLPDAGITQCIKTRKVVLCTGSVPTEIPLPHYADGIERIDIATALDHGKLISRLPLDKNNVVAVVGGSHSAVIVLYNLVMLATTNNAQIQIKWFTRHALRYAESTDGSIVDENSGLKGVAAYYARTELEDDRLPISNAGRYITKVGLDYGHLDTPQVAAHLNECTHIVQATGFTHRGLHINIGGTPVDLLFNGDCGMLKYPNGNLVPGLYGARAVFPRYVEKAGGRIIFTPPDTMLGCMKQAQQVVPLWFV